MGLYEDITSARELMGIPDEATIQQVRDRYRTMIKKWHPDCCADDPGMCREMTEKLLHAYKTLINYCYNYRFSFSQDDVEKYLP